MAEKNAPQIIIKRFKKVAAGHHGGAWKIALADYMTALVAVFMVLWATGLDESIRAEVEATFSPNVVGMKNGAAAGQNMLMDGGPPASVLVGREAQQQRFQEIRENLQQQLDAAGLKQLDANVEIIITDEGLRIELIEGTDGETFFESGSSLIKPVAARLLGVIAGELKSLRHEIIMEGHTDGAPYGTRTFTNWELSAARANSARRALEAGGVWPENIAEVRGYADKKLRMPLEPKNPQNRRISILLPFREVNPLAITPGALQHVLKDSQTAPSTAPAH